MPLRCLIVDDSDAFLATAGAVLERDGVAVVGVASSIAQALRQVRALQPDVVLADIGLGEESGFDLARLVRDGDRGPAVILISARDEADYAELIAASPAAGFLAKADLSAGAIARLLGRTPRTGATAVSALPAPASESPSTKFWPPGSWLTRVVAASRNSAGKASREHE
jgi:DNA-binding NarL/FixJ family response regulator